MANLGKYIAQIVVAGGQIVGRAFSRALKEELRNSQQAAAAQGGSRSDRTKAATESLKLGMSIQEARQILDVPDLTKPNTILDNYNHLFAANDKDSGGSFYLQSKVYRAKERIDAELRNSGVDLKTFYGITDAGSTNPDAPNLNAGETTTEGDSTTNKSRSSRRKAS